LPDCEVGRGCSWCGCRRVRSWGWPRKLSDFCVQVQIESFGLQLPRSLLHYSETGLAVRRRWELGLCQAASCCSWLENWQITWPVGLAHRPSATLPPHFGIFMLLQPILPAGQNLFPPRIFLVSSIAGSFRRQQLRVTTSQWRLFRTPRPPRSPVAPSRPLVC
jgi:hypothetical protein